MNIEKYLCVVEEPMIKFQEEVLITKEEILNVKGNYHAHNQVEKEVYISEESKFNAVKE